MIEKKGNRSELWDPYHKPEWVFPTQVSSRPDNITAAIVEKGIAMIGAHGMEAAAAFLLDNKIPVDVAKRVLMRPSERRQPKEIKKRP